MNTLLITPYLPYPPISGGKLLKYLFHLSKYLYNAFIINSKYIFVK